MRLGIVADTHIPRRARSLPLPLLEGLAGVDLILHAGDMSVLGVLDELGQIAPIIGVIGNNDPVELFPSLERQKVLELENWRIGLVHGHEGSGRTTVERALATFANESALDCVVFGHSHQPYLAWHGKTLLFNPGSPTDHRRAPAGTYGILELRPEGLSAQIVQLPG